jgi:predicted ATPase
MNLKAKNVENKEAKYIDKIEIKGLFGRYDVDWTLNPDVNILVGENGTGKSTILKGIENIFAILDDVYNQLSPSISFNIKILKAMKVVLKENFNTSFFIQENANKHGGTLEYFINEKRFFQFNSDEFTFIPKHIEEYISKIAHKYNVDFIKTFDNELTITDLDRSFKPNLKSELDFQLDKKLSEYIEFQLNLSKKVINQGKDVNKVYEKKRLFIDTLNRLFSDTEKRVDENENKIVFQFDNLEKIEAHKLSSGEKQLLVILLTVLCQDEKPSILLMDEPEISLHVSWQYELIKIIRELNPNCQLIIVTHSTSIFSKGWMDKFFFTTGVEGILHPITEKV